MLKHTVGRFNFGVPEPFQIAILLSTFTLIVASLTTPFSFSDNIFFWGQGLWSLLSFTTQMCLILLGGFVLASSGAVKDGLIWVAGFPKTPLQAYILCFLISAFGCWLNWGMGLILGAFLCLELGKKNSKIHFPLLVTTSYMGFIFWHGGLSGSIPLVVASREGFSFQWIQRVIPINETLFSTFNIFILLGLLFAFLGLILIFHVFQKNPIVPLKKMDESFTTKAPSNKQNKFDASRTLLIFMIATFFFVSFSRRGISLGINEMNLLLVLLGLVLHKSLKSYLHFAKLGCEKLVSILVQFPIYGGIMTVIVQSGLGEKISQFFVGISDVNTFPIFSFLSAGLVNIFVPSGGGQWAVQAPIVLSGAKELGVPLNKAIMSIAWGDAWTNLAQPFWALPLLSIVNMEIKSIWFYCLGALAVSGVVIGTSLFFI